MDVIPALSMSDLALRDALNILKYFVKLNEKAFLCPTVNKFKSDSKGMRVFFKLCSHSSYTKQVDAN
jgi:hypothetical protein